MRRKIKIIIQEKNVKEIKLSGLIAGSYCLLIALKKKNKVLNANKMRLIFDFILFHAEAVIFVKYVCNNHNNHLFILIIIM